MSLPHFHVLGAAAWQFARPEVLLGLVAVPLVALAGWWSFVRQRRGLSLFAGATPQGTSPSAARALLRVVLTSVGLAALIVAMARPQADPVEEDTTVRGRDIAFLVDVSRSMLSRDVVPSRLERAKLWIKDLTNTLRGDRVALVAFAGVPVVQSPLTLDYGFFGMALDELSPTSSPRGGTLIGDAIRKTLSEVFEPGAGRYRDIILITDGEDQGSFPVEAAKKAGEMGVRIIAIGIGSELEGAPVPAKAGSQNYMEYEGQQVRSKLDSSTLARITQAAAQARGDASGGVFLNVGTGTIDLDKVYHQFIASAEQREMQSKANVVYRELFPHFLFVALVCLGIEPLISVRVRRRGRQAGVLPIPAGVLAAAVLLLATSLASAQQSGTEAKAAAQSPAELYNSGRRLFLDGKFAEATEAFRNADLNATDPQLSALARFNLGQSLLKQATTNQQPDPAQSIPRLEEAARAFRGALAINPRDKEAARNVEVARRLMKDAQAKRADPTSGDKKDQSKDKQDQKSKDGQQDQQGQDSKQHQDNADKLKDLAQRQSQAADKSQQAQQQPDQASKDAKTQESKADQSQLNKDTQQRMDKAGQQSQEKMDQAQKEQQAASQALEKGDPKSAEEHQRKAAELLQQASDAEQAAAQQLQQQSREPEPKHDETAAQLLDKEKRQREARQQVLRALKGRVQPVDKDW